MIIHSAEQLTEGWEKIKKGRPSASQFSRIITAQTRKPAKAKKNAKPRKVTAPKSILSKGYKGYINELIGECFCPDFKSFIGSRATDRGLELEPEAREAFAAHTGLTLKQVGFITRDDTIVGCSPDALILDSGGNAFAGLEIKCPYPATHVGYVLEGVLPDDYKQQVHGGMAVTGLNEWHFWSYFPGMQPFHIVVRRDEYTEKLSTALDEFLILYNQALTAARPKLRINAVKLA